MALSLKKFISRGTATKARQYLIPKTHRNLSFKYNSSSSSVLPSLWFFRSNSSSPLSKFRCNSCRPSSKFFRIEPEPIFSSVKSFAPATIADVGDPNYDDVINCAIDGLGNYVTVEISDHPVPPSKVSINSVESEVDPLWNYDTLDPSFNSAAIAARSVMERLGIKSVGLSLTIEKGLSALGKIGSSAANAAAAAVAVNEIFGRKLSVVDLIQASLSVLPYYKDCHIENLTAAFMGGFVMIDNYVRLEIIPLEFPAEKDLFFVLVTPEIETRGKLRTVRITDNDFWICRRMVSQMHGPERINRGWPKCESLIPGLKVGKKAEGAFGCRIFWDKQVDGLDVQLDMMGPYEKLERTSKIPGLAAVMKAAWEKGVLGCKLIGTRVVDGEESKEIGNKMRVVAVTDDEEEAKEIGNRMVEAFLNHGGVKASAVVHNLDRVGARVISSQPYWTKFCCYCSREA
ncbi:homoserine kinase-like [Telopea speciosissima]|uniref:homoserine kinase-like n=1 Tax=Telopea speciosissima TaxID=54955 RepID=UPI001CC6B86B|nr:homoserine kinase-like [Telopea speciosissima]